MILLVLSEWVMKGVEGLDARWASRTVTLGMMKMIRSGVPAGLAP